MILANCRRHEIKKLKNLLRQNLATSFQRNNILSAGSNFYLRKPKHPLDVSFVCKRIFCFAPYPNTNFSYHWSIYLYRTTTNILSCTVVWRRNKKCSRESRNWTDLHRLELVGQFIRTSCLTLIYVSHLSFFSILICLGLPREESFFCIVFYFFYLSLFSFISFSFFSF